MARTLVAVAVGLAVSWCAGPAAAQPATDQSPPIDFAREVQPILQQRCHKCHGGVHRESELSLLSAADAEAPAASGASAVVPGRPAESELLRRIASDDEFERMPPAGEPLTAAQVDLLQRWIAEGAEWPRHWSLKPLRRGPPPAVERNQWVRNSLDLFVLARLEAAGMTPAPEAEPAVLVRRLYLDLLGLLPEPDVVEAFCSSTEPDRYERLVDRLLANPHFGERWARHWLDQARYADTDGFEVDGPRPFAWRWRDWVIAAYNDDLPFDRFTVAQLAGDLLPEATDLQRLATGFHRQSLTNREGGIDQGEARYKELVDRLNATATIWLGLTAGCAQCHDHPSDSLSQRDYFRLLAFFENSRDTELRLPADRELSLPGFKEPPREIVARVVASSEKRRKAIVYRRGDYLQPGEAVEPGMPGGLLPAEAADSAADTPPDRLALARWIVDRDNPLTPRVAANQLWLRLLGEGLVRTADDFGAHGEPPTHPELLDWLAAEYQTRQWSTKAMIRLIVTSAAYRQSSRYRPEQESLDPANKLLRRQNRFRVEAELVRDLHLGAAGLLNPMIGGPSVYPPLAAEVAKLSFRGNYVWPTSTGGERYRRGMYTFYKRTLPHPNLDVFDCPDAATARMRRETSITPLQALTTLNNEVYAEAARAFARRVLRESSGDDRRRIAHAFRCALGRQPSHGEQARLRELLEAARSWYREQPEQAALLIADARPAGVDQAEAAAWIAALGVILNLDEFLTRE